MGNVMLPSCDYWCGIVYLSREIKVRLLGSAGESILLYGSDAWTVTEKLTKQIHGCYTWLLRTVLGVQWDQFLTNKELYGNLPNNDKIRGRRLMLAGHFRRSKNEKVSKLVPWTPRHRQRKRRGALFPNFCMRVCHFSISYPTLW